MTQKTKLVTKDIVMLVDALTHFDFIYKERIRAYKPTKRVDLETLYHFPSSRVNAKYLDEALAVVGDVLIGENLIEETLESPKPLREHHSNAEAEFAKINSLIPKLSFKKLVYVFDEKRIADNPYQLFRMIVFGNIPDLAPLSIPGFSKAYDTLTTGNWNGRRIYEDDGISDYSPPERQKLYTPENIVTVKEGSEEDDAFHVLSALGFFKRSTHDAPCLFKRVPAEGTVQYFMGNKIEMFDEQGGKYRTYNSIFKQYCSDQVLLNFLKSTE